MFKLLVCDDEKWIREGICTAIDWEALGVTTILKARDGQRAVELVNSEKPDLVITDIRMPLFGGLEMIEAVKEQVDPACIIVISGYSNFEYARTALKLGVADYLLKPIDEAALIAAVRKCLDALAKRKRQAQHEQSAQLYQLSGWLENEDSAEQEIAAALGRLQVELQEETEVLAATCRLLPDTPTGAALPQLRCGEQAAGNKTVRSVLLRKSATDFVCLFFAQSPPDDKLLPLEHILVRELWGDDYPPYTIGVGEWVAWQKAWITYRQSRQALSYRLLLPAVSVHFYSVVSRRKEKALENFRHFHLSRPMAFLMSRDALQYRQWLENAFADLQGNSEVLSAQEVLEFFSRLVQNAGVVWEIADRPDYQIYCDGIALTWQRESLFNQLAQLPDKLPDSKNVGAKRHFTEALAYIGAHYDGPLTMQEVADMVDLSASYFSKMFSECAGEPFLKYVARLRMDKAKALLKSSNDKIYEVAEKVGYSDYRIFSKNFKDYVGMSPAEYRDHAN